jgi:hypothetical protein
VFQVGDIEPKGFVDMICEEIGRLDGRDEEYLRSLRALSAAADIYRRAKNTTIDVRGLRVPLRDAFWVPTLHVATSEVGLEDCSLTQDLVLGAGVLDNFPH